MICAFGRPQWVSNELDMDWQNIPALLLQYQICSRGSTPFCHGETYVRLLQLDVVFCLVPYRPQASLSVSSSNNSGSAGGKQGPISLQQRMQQALTADIAPPPPPKHAPNPQLKQGPGSGSGLGSEGAGMQEEDTGFWDLVYILYPEFAEAAGVGPLRELVPHWSLLERTLMVRVCYQPYH